MGFAATTKRGCDTDFAATLRVHATGAHDAAQDAAPSPSALPKETRELAEVILPGFPKKYPNRSRSPYCVQSLVPRRDPLSLASDSGRPVPEAGRPASRHCRADRREFGA